MVATDVSFPFFPSQFNSLSLPSSTLYSVFLFLAQCLPGTSSSDGLEPCASCEKGSYQERYAETRCTRCPDGASTRDERSCRITLRAKRKKICFFFCLEIAGGGEPEHSSSAFVRNDVVFNPSAGFS